MTHLNWNPATRSNRNTTTWSNQNSASSQCSSQLTNCPEPKPPLPPRSLQQHWMIPPPSCDSSSSGPINRPPHRKETSGFKLLLNSCEGIRVLNIATESFQTFRLEKLAGGDLMGIDRRKIENRYKSGNKSLTTWSFNLGFLYDHYKFIIFHYVK